MNHAMNRLLELTSEVQSLMEEAQELSRLHFARSKSIEAEAIALRQRVMELALNYEQLGFLEPDLPPQVSTILKMAHESQVSH